MDLLWEEFRLPIWVTEFDWNGQVVEEVWMVAVVSRRASPGATTPSTPAS